MKKRRIAGFALNALLRAGIVAMLAHVLRHPDDPRYAGKAIPIRNLIIVGGLSMVFPALYANKYTRRWKRYPVGVDNIYLSIFWLDMLGNWLDLYDTYLNFDLIPHFHGSGALAAVLRYGFDLPGWRALGVANAAHAALEAQEIATDAFFGTRNVRGAWDSLGDLSAGLLGTIAYVGPSILSSLHEDDAS